MVFVSDWHQERMDSILFVLYYKLGEYDRMSGVDPEIANPPLYRCSRWHMHHEGVVPVVKCGHGLQALHVRPVA